MLRLDEKSRSNGRSGVKSDVTDELADRFRSSPAQNRRTDGRTRGGAWAEEFFVCEPLTGKLIAGGCRSMSIAVERCGSMPAQLGCEPHERTRTTIARGARGGPSAVAATRWAEFPSPCSRACKHAHPRLRSLRVVRRASSLSAPRLTRFPFRSPFRSPAARPELLEPLLLLLSSLRLQYLRTEKGRAARR